jgi:hypothetical protein
MSKKPFDQQKFDAALAELMSAIKYWGNLEPEDPVEADEALSDVWVAYEVFRPQYKKYRKLTGTAESEPELTQPLFQGFIESVNNFLIKAAEHGIDPDGFFGRSR